MSVNDVVVAKRFSAGEERDVQCEPSASIWMGPGLAFAAGAIQAQAATLPGAAQRVAASIGLDSQSVMPAARYRSRIALGGSAAHL